mmetsp:Transcript_18074/g.42581  ORF Transcript_18074/g.42581 Transcript_18074/m.42581 type:complete len:202 (-) Transcript_18074:231-836(-)
MTSWSSDLHHTRTAIDTDANPTSTTSIEGGGSGSTASTLVSAWSTNARTAARLEPCRISNFPTSVRALGCAVKFCIAMVAILAFGRWISVPSGSCMIVYANIIFWTRPLNFPQICTRSPWENGLTSVSTTPITKFSAIGRSERPIPTVIAPRMVMMESAAIPIVATRMGAICTHSNSLIAVTMNFKSCLAWGSSSVFRRWA